MTDQTVDLELRELLSLIETDDQLVALALRALHVSGYVARNSFLTSVAEKMMHYGGTLTERQTAAVRRILPNFGMELCELMVGTTAIPEVQRFRDFAFGLTPARKAVDQAVESAVENSSITRQHPMWGMF